MPPLRNKAKHENRMAHFRPRRGVVDATENTARPQQLTKANRIEKNTNKSDQKCRKTSINGLRTLPDRLPKLSK